jgi:hypothetical protein
MGPALLGSGFKTDESSLSKWSEALSIALSGLAPEKREQLEKLLAALDHPLTRWPLTGIGKNFREVNRSELELFLTRWKSSRFASLRAAYLAFVQLSGAAYYALSISWQEINYPGPVEL